MKIKHLCAIVMIVFAAIACAVAGFSVLSFSSTGNWLNGQKSAAYEKQFDENLTHRDLSIHLWNAIGYVLFGEGKEGVLIGQDGWLFSNEEFIYLKEFDQNIERHKNDILSVRNKLSERKIKLLVVPIPSKARIYQDKLGRYKFPLYWQNQYQNFIEFLNQNEIFFVDLHSVFKKNKSQNIFLKTDTHWTPLGARLASLAVESAAAMSWPYLSWEMNKHKSLKKKLIEHEGDLRRYTVNGGFAEIFGLQKDQFYQWNTMSIEKEDNDLFGEVDLPVTLAGTSYSANKLWNFEGFLKQILATDILNVSDEGLGPFEVMDNYLNSNLYKKSPPKLVIWEIPERYLAIKYDEELTN